MSSPDQVEAPIQPPLDSQELAPPPVAAVAKRARAGKPNAESGSAELVPADVAAPAVGAATAPPPPMNEAAAAANPVLNEHLKLSSDHEDKRAGGKWTEEVRLFKFGLVVLFLKSEF